MGHEQFQKKTVLAGHEHYPSTVFLSTIFNHYPKFLPQVQGLLKIRGEINKSDLTDFFVRGTRNIATATMKGFRLCQ